MSGVSRGTPGIALIDTATRANQDITSEKEITSGDPLTFSDKGLYRIKIRADDINQTGAGCKLNLRVVLVIGAVEREVYNDEVDISSGEDKCDKTSEAFYAAASGTVKTYILSDDSGDTSVDITADLMLGNS